VPTSSAEQLPKPSEKASVKDRLTRMFSTKDPGRVAAAADAATSRNTTPGNRSTAPSPPPAAGSKPAPQRKMSITEAKAKTNGKAPPSRFDLI
ncbi:hypothetical protein OFC47_26300, partial [Escherichia coli]|nr:hypothetical protein [Escherichia coli]